MAKLKIELGNKLVDGVKQLAICHYGDNGDTSVGRVVESALEMRLLFFKLVKGGGNEVEEPIVNWDFDNTQPTKQLTDELRNLLFRRK